jgi:hypothetical protein
MSETVTDVTNILPLNLFDLKAILFSTLVDTGDVNIH